jgi:predicted transcriptional regulator
VAEQPTEKTQEEPRSLADLTTEIVAAYVAGNTVASADLSDLIGVVSSTLATLGQEQAEPAGPDPAVPVGRSVHDDHLVCLVCGKQQKILRRHLQAAHQLTPQAYSEQFGLRSDYPMTAPGYSRQRSEMAKQVGLGQRVETSPRRRRPRSGA